MRNRIKFFVLIIGTIYFSNNYSFSQEKDTILDVAQFAIEQIPRLINRNENYYVQKELDPVDKEFIFCFEDKYRSSKQIKNMTGGNSKENITLYIKAINEDTLKTVKGNFKTFNKVDYDSLINKNSDDYFAILRWEYCQYGEVYEHPFEVEIMFEKLPVYISIMNPVKLANYTYFTVFYISRTSQPSWRHGGFVPALIYYNPMNYKYSFEILKCYD